MAKWIEFVESGTSQSGKTKIWNVFPKSVKELPLKEHYLGTIAWYGPWRKYCFYPHKVGDGDLLVFEQDCLRDIADFIQEKTKEHREAAKLSKAQ